MKERIINRVQSMLPHKMLLRQQFSKRIKDRKRHGRRYNVFSYRPSTKPSQFNRWQDYKRTVNRLYQ